MMKNLSADYLGLSWSINSLIHFVGHVLIYLFLTQHTSMISSHLVSVTITTLVIHHLIILSFQSQNFCSQILSSIDIWHPLGLTPRLFGPSCSRFLFFTLFSFFWVLVFIIILYFLPFQFFSLILVFFTLVTFRILSVFHLTVFFLFIVYLISFFF